MSPFAIETWRPRSVLPLELWSVPWRGQPLYRSLGAERVATLRQRGASEEAIDLELGAAVAAALSWATTRAPPFEAAVLAGGLALRPGLMETARSYTSVPLRTVEQPRFVGSGLPGLVVDLGQTSLKLSWGAQRACLDRSPELRLWRAEEGFPPAEVASPQRGRLARYVAEPLASALAAAPELPTDLVLALPCAIGDRGVAGPCTYPGLDEAWPTRMLEELFLALPPSHPWQGGGVRVRLVNDASLAAWAARERLSASTGLVITLGFGPGGAWFGADPPGE